MIFFIFCKVLFEYIYCHYCFNFFVLLWKDTESKWKYESVIFKGLYSVARLWPPQQLFSMPFLFARLLCTRLKMPCWIFQPRLQPVCASWPIPVQWNPRGSLLGCSWEKFPPWERSETHKQNPFCFVFLLMRTDSGSCGSHFETSPTVWGGWYGMIERSLIHDVVSQHHWVTE